MNWKDCIVSDLKILVGKPIIKGTRLSVELILDRLADGWSQEDISRSYPNLTPEALQAVCAFASEVLRYHPKQSCRMKPFLGANENFPAPSVMLLREQGYNTRSVEDDMIRTRPLPQS